MERSNTSKRSGQPVFSASGKLVEIVTTQLDVTERKLAEQALPESEAKFALRGKRR